jgi:c-di-GMP-related signal transduction protein
MQPNLDPREGIYVARQPILDASGHVFGYELLYRAAAHHTACHDSGDVVAARVLNDAVLTLGLDTLTAGRRAFINLTRRILLGDFATLLPASGVVLEVLEDMEIDAEIVEACRRLQHKGYSLALDDFTLDTDAKTLLPFARFVKVDVLATSSQERRTIRQAVPKSVGLIAEKVETAEMFDETRTAGYQLFQGYYFCRPKTFSTAVLPPRRLAYAQLFVQLNRPNVHLGEIENLIKHDASLSFRILRCVNSAAFGIWCEIHSIRQALVLLGIDQVRKWASIWALAGLNSGASPELLTTVILRARCCELIASEVMEREAASEYFLLGLCSLLDVMLGQPMAAALEELPLRHNLRSALLGEENIARSLLDAVVAYERGMWDEATERSQAIGVGAEALPAAYANALKWARDLSQIATAA